MESSNQDCTIKKNVTFAVGTDYNKMASSKIPSSKKNAFATILEIAEEKHAIDLANPMSNLTCPDKLIDLVKIGHWVRQIDRMLFLGNFKNCRKSIFLR